MMAVSIRSLASQGFSLFDILGVRSAAAVLLLLTAALLRPELRADTRPRQMKLTWCAISFITSRNMAWALSLTLLPLAMVFSLEFTMPAWTALLAVWLLGEKLTPEPHRCGRFLASSACW